MRDGPDRESTGARRAASNRPVRRGREFLHTPGPTGIPDRILNAMHRPALDFTAPEFTEIARSCFEDLKAVFQTTGDIFLLTSSGHGGWEAALVNLLNPGDKALMPETGRFSNAWRDMAEALGFAVELIPNDWRSPIDPQQIEDRLRADTEGKIKAVLAVHVETASGVQSDIKAIRQAIDAAGHPALYIVDAIASLATTDLPMDDWSIDVTIAAAQKGLMTPPGLAPVAVSEKAMKVAEACATPREYWSWHKRLVPAYYRKFCGTAPEHLVFALREAIDMLMEEGLEHTFARHHRLAEATRRAVAVWCEGGALEFNVVEPAARADSLTVVRTPDGVDAEAIRTVAREDFGMSMGGGLSDLAGKVFRIGHMGDLNEPMLIGALGSVEAALKVCGVPHGSGGVGAAVDYLAETAG